MSYLTPGTQATTRDGKPINVGDAITLQGFVTAIGAGAGGAYGPLATLTITLAGSGVSITTALASDAGASTQTL